MEGGAVYTTADAHFESAEPYRNTPDVGLATYIDGAFQASAERTLKRVGPSSSNLGRVCRQRMTRPKTIGNAENVAPASKDLESALGAIATVEKFGVGTANAKLQATAAILEDVTNKVQQAGNNARVMQKQLLPPKANAQPSSKAIVDRVASEISSVLASDVESDSLHAEDAQYCVEYVADIYDNMRMDESSHLPIPDYMRSQAQISCKRRAILIDWLVDVHRKYKLRLPTLYLAVSLTDRYMEKRSVQRGQLQLVGVTSLFIAAKYEDVHPPQINDFVYITDQAYTQKEVVDMEVSILSALEFNICTPLPVSFLERYQRVNGCTEAHKDLAKYLLELTLTDHKMVKYSPSHLAAAAILLSNKLLHRRHAWTPTAVKHTKMTETSLEECAKDLCDLLESAETSQLKAVRKKYSHSKLHAVATINFRQDAANRPAQLNMSSNSSSAEIDWDMTR